MTRSLTMTRNRVLIAAMLAVPALMAGCAGGPERGTGRVFAVGDCVSVPVADPSSSTAVQATEVTCSADPSYTVGAIASGDGHCPSAEYQHLPAQLADPPTARLCLVPNLVADHCYEMGMPIGVVELADCTDRGQGVLVQVTQRLDVRDQSACPRAHGYVAWPYPSPARTYCTRTVY